MVPGKDCWEAICSPAIISMVFPGYGASTEGLGWPVATSVVACSAIPPEVYNEDTQCRSQVNTFSKVQNRYNGGNAGICHVPKNDSKATSMMG